ncbi:MAG: hypothetical protein AB9835_00085 [Eubacteriales bacterium]
MKFFMYGAGNIGRGFIAPLFAQSGYSVAFCDINKAVIEALNSRGTYKRVVVDRSGEREIAVPNVSGVDGGSMELVAAAILEADAAATSVGVGALPYIAPGIAAGVKARAAKNAPPLDFILCENKLDAADYLRSLVAQKLEGEELDYFNRCIGFVPASVGMMVPVQTPEMQKGDILRVCTEDYGTLPVDAAAFKGVPPTVKGLKLSENFEYEIRKKLFMFNMSHCVTAYLGNLKGYTLIWNAIENPDIREVVEAATYTVCDALAAMYPSVDAAEQRDYATKLLYRYGNPGLGDTVARVGGDIKRKLSPDDRLVGALRTVKEQGRITAPFYVAIAAALRFAHDPFSSTPAQDILTQVCGFAPDSEDYAKVMEVHRRLEGESALEIYRSMK